MLVKFYQIFRSIPPDVPNFALWDFNNCNLKKTLSDFYQYVNCHKSTDWNVFQTASENIDELTEVVCDYVSFLYRYDYS